MIEKINLQLIKCLFETNEENILTIKNCWEERDLLFENNITFLAKNFFITFKR